MPAVPDGGTGPVRACEGFAQAPTRATRLPPACLRRDAETASSRESGRGLAGVPARRPGSAWAVGIQTNLDTGLGRGSGMRVCALLWRDRALRRPGRWNAVRAGTVAGRDRLSVSRHFSGGWKGDRTGG